MTDTSLQKVYRLAKRLKELAPWTFMYEQEIFGIRMPENGKYYYVSIMGSSGMYFGLSAYEGDRGIFAFLDFQYDDEQWMRPEELLLIPHFMVSFEDRDRIEAPVRKKMKELGFSFRGKNAWPDIRQVIPAFVPVMPEGEALNELIIILEQSLEVLERAKTNKSFIFPEDIDTDKYLVRTMLDNENGDKQWCDSYRQPEEPTVTYHMSFNEYEQKRIKELPRSKDTFQADIALLQNQICHDSHKPYFISLFVVLSKQRGLVIDFKLLSPEDGVDAMHAQFPDLLIKTINRINQQPAAIEIRHPALFQIAQKPLDDTKIKLKYKPKLNMIDTFLREFDKSF